MLVEAIETLFVPVVIHNNAGGRDAEVLKRFDEPAWNNPVVRFIDAAGKDLIARREGVWSDGELAARMVSALTVAKSVVPAWLSRAKDELSTGAPARAVFGMHCFWDGQGKLGALEGVVDVRPVFVDGAEACEVLYRAERVDYASLLKAAHSLQCASTVWAIDDAQLALAKELAPQAVRRLAGVLRAAPVSDDLRTLRTNRAWMTMPWTRGQRVWANALLRAGASLAPGVLSSRQADLLDALERVLAKHPAAVEGLEFPTDPARLGVYEDELRARMAAAR